MSLPRRIWSKGFLFFWWEKRRNVFFLFLPDKGICQESDHYRELHQWKYVLTDSMVSSEKKCRNQQFVFIDAWIDSFSDRASRWSMGRVVFLDCVWQRLRNWKTEKTSLLWQSVSFAWRKRLSRSSTGNGRLQYRKLPKYVKLMKECYY